MTQLPDQETLWDKKHKSGEHDMFRDIDSPFAVYAERFMMPGSFILDLGCGVASDARYFAEHNHHVEATDISSVVLAQNALHPIQNVQYRKIDLTELLPYEDGVFDVVYAHLSLHYFIDVTTKQIFHEIHRVLKPGGQLFFKCKSLKSQYEQQDAEQVEPNVYVLKKNGHVRHLFSENYIKTLTKDLFDIVALHETKSLYGKTEANFIDCYCMRKDD